MIESITETTSRGDTFGFTTDSKLRTSKVATRVFIIKLTSGSNYITECLAALPKRGNVHPDYPSCFVRDIMCEVEGKDPHIYQATVTYKSPDPRDSSNNNGETPPPEYPWSQPTDISITSDSSFSEVNDLAYAYFGTKLVGDVWSSDGAFALSSPVSGSGTRQTEPIVNVPFSEYPASLPDEPEPVLVITVAFAVLGSNLSHVTGFTKNAFTVNNSSYNIAGYSIPRYCGYIQDVSASKKIYTYKTIEYTYWAVSIQMAVRPKSWIRAMTNMSFNCIGEEGTKARIKLFDPDKGQSEPSTDALRITPEGKAIDVTEDGRLDDSVSASSTYVNLYLTKKLANWYSMSIPGI